MIKVLLVVVLVLVIVVALVVWIRRSRSGRRLVAARAAGSDAPKIFFGDVLRRHVVTSGSLARLELFDWGIRVRGMALSRWLISTWEAEYTELAMAELVATRYSRIAIRFRLRGEAGSTAFLTHRHEAILSLLEQRGIPVNRAVQTIGGPADLDALAR